MNISSEIICRNALAKRLTRISAICLNASVNPNASKVSEVLSKDSLYFVNVRLGAPVDTGGKNSLLLKM